MGVKAMVALGLGLGAWTSIEGQSLTWLGTLGGRSSAALGVSADGSVVVGRAHNANLLSSGSDLWEAYAISPDGRYIVGQGYNAATRRLEAFLLDTGFPARGSQTTTVK